MIKKVIDLDYHIDILRNDNVLTDSPYLIGYKFYKVEEEKYYTLFATCCYLIKLDNELNIESKICLGYYLSSRVIYNKRNKIFYILCDSCQQDILYYISKNNIKTIEVEVNSNFVNYKNSLIIINSDHSSYQAYDEKCNKIDINLNPKDIIKEDFENKNDDFSNLHINSKYLIDKSKIIDNRKYLLLFPKIEYKLDYKIVYVINNKIKTLLTFKNDIQRFIWDFYVYKNKAYILYHAYKNSYKIRIYDKKSNIIDEEDIKAYYCKLTIINNYLCLICDLPRNYTSEQKKYKNQEMMGNSTIMILEKLD